MKSRQLAIVVIKATGIPLAILVAQCAGTALPFIPAAIIGGSVCGAAGYSLIKSLWKLIES